MKRFFDPGSEGTVDGGGNVELSADQILAAKVPAFKAAGAIRELTVQELIPYAQKGIDAESKWQDAARKERDLQAKEQSIAQKQAILDDLEAMKTGDPHAFLRTASRMGLDQAGAQQLYNYVTGQGGEQPPAGTSNNGLINITQLPKEVLEAVELVKRMKATGQDPANLLQVAAANAADTANVRAKGHIAAAIDKHPMLAKILKKGPAREKAVAKVLEDLKSRVEGGTEYPAALNESVNAFADITESLAGVLAPTPKPDTNPYGLAGIGGSGGPNPFTAKAPQQPKWDPVAGHNQPGAISDFLAKQIAFDQATDQDIEE